MVDGASLVGGRQRVLRIVVLAAASVAGISGANDGHVALAMAGRSSVGIGIRRCAALYMGLRLDWAWHAIAVCPTPATGRSGLLPLSAEPHVLGLRRRLDRIVDRFRPRQSSGLGGRRRGCTRRAPVCRLL